MTTPTEAQRAAFEAFFADSRRNRGPSKRPTFDRLADGTYADDHTQRHWWTWQQGLAQQPGAEPLTADQESRCMFVARLGNMQQNGHTWLTIPAVLALLNDCDMLASLHGAAPTAPAPLPAALLVRDLAASLSVEPLDVCKALDDLGHGQYSVNMAVPAAAVGAVERYFGAAPQAAPVAPGPQPHKGLTVQAGADGVWLAFAASTGRHALLNVERIADSHGGIVSKALRDWAADVQGAAPQQTAPQAPTVQPLPARLVRFTLRDMQAERKRLDGFLALGNEAARAAEYDEWIAALEAYCGAHGITATTAPTPEAP